MKYIFFCIYNSQYLDGKNRKNPTPWIDAIGMMIGGSSLWLGLFFEVYFFYILNENFPPDSILSLGLLALLVYVHYFFFIKDKKYEDIYEQYKTSNLNTRKINIIVCFSWFLLPTIIGMFIAMKWHKVL